MASVIAVIATHRRPRELARLLDSLTGVKTAIVCDNGASNEIRTLVEFAGHRYLAPAENLGCGGGLRMAEEHAWQIADSEFTHLLVLDDDVVLESDTVPKLIAALERERADAAYPLVVGPEGRTGWLPGLKDETLHRLGRTSMAPAEYRARFGVAAAEFDWAQGICLLVRRESVEATGFHRGDFWVRGEDLDFSLRLTAQGRGIFVPDVVVQHLPPQADAATQPVAEYLRHAALIQNMAYISLTQPHGRPIRSSLVPACLRFLRQWGLKAIPDLVRAVRRGAVERQPAGVGNGETFRRRFESLGVT